eukprot:2910937-Pleurochrysis_carterae.AAC.2
MCTAGLLRGSPGAPCEARGGLSVIPLYTRVPRPLTQQIAARAAVPLSRYLVLIHNLKRQSMKTKSYKLVVSSLGSRATRLPCLF